MEELDFIEELLNLFAVDRLAEVYVKDEEYQKRLKEEDLIYQKLSENLIEISIIIILSENNSKKTVYNPKKILYSYISALIQQSTYAAEKYNL